MFGTHKNHKFSNGAMNNTMEAIEVVVGTYENIVLGFKTVQSVANNNHSLETSFTDDSHRGALRCLSVSANGILASSSTDDSIRLHSLRRRKEIGGLFQHSGTVNCITFYGKGYMFSASEDGTICMWKSKNWELLRTLKGHKAKVMSVAVHPSGKLGFSVGSDKSLLTWDLLTGKLAFQRKIQDVAQSIFFTSSGDHYILQFDRKLEICDLEDTKTVREIPLEWRINCLVILKDYVIIGGDDRYVKVVNLTTGKTVLTLDSADQDQSDFNSRVKSVQALEEDEQSALVYVGTSHGCIKGYRVDFTEGAEESELVLSYDAGVRLTCMAVYKPTAENERNGKSVNTEQEVQKGKEAEEGARSDNSDGDQEGQDEEEADQVKRPKQNGKPKKRTRVQETEPLQKKQKLEKAQRTSDAFTKKKKRMKNKNN